MNQRFYPGSGTLLSAASLLLLAACASSGSSFETGAGGSTGTSNTSSGSGGNNSSGSGTAGNDTTTSGGAGDSVTSGGAGDAAAGVGGNITMAGAGGATGAGGAVGVGGAGGTAVVAACPAGHGYAKTPGAVEVCHEFFGNDNSRNQINYVNQFTSTNPGGVVWTAKVGDSGENSPRTMEIVSNAKATGGKALMVSVNKGFEEYDLTNGTKVASVLTQTGGVTGATRLPDGTTALGMLTIIKIVGATGAAVSQFNLPVGPELRAINRDPKTGHYWFSKMEYIYETDAQGNQLWKGYMGVGTKGYAVWWREGGGAFATTGEPASIVEVNNVGAQGTILTTTGGQTSFAFLDFFSGFVRLPNGNYVVANWLGHLPSPSPDAAQVVEFAAPCGVDAAGLGKLGPCATPKNEVVWLWECKTCPNKNQTLSRQITNVLVLK